MKIRHPDPAAIRAAMGRLERVVDARRFPRLDMLTMGLKQRVLFGRECGTTACHGGWYALAVIAEMTDAPVEWIPAPGLGFRQMALASRRPGAEGCISWKSGAIQLALDLGFADIEELLWWARKYPSLWGNDWGFEMFIDVRAFGRRRTIRGVIAHWREVAERLEALMRAKAVPA